MRRLPERFTLGVRFALACVLPACVWNSRSDALGFRARMRMRTSSSAEKLVSLLFLLQSHL